MVTLQFLSEIAKTFNERYGDLFEVWEVNTEDFQDDPNDRNTWLLRFGSMQPGQEGDDLVLMNDFGITFDASKPAKTLRMGQCPPNPTVDQVVETMLKIATDYWVVEQIQES